MFVRLLFLADWGGGGGIVAGACSSGRCNCLFVVLWVPPLGFLLVGGGGGDGADLLLPPGMELPPKAMQDVCT